jgi:hypothetical protein
MIFQVQEKDKEFLLEQDRVKFDESYSSGIIDIPAHWEDYYFKQGQIGTSEISELKLIEKFLLQDKKTMMECFFNSELPRDIQQSIQLLLRKTTGQAKPFVFKNKPFEKKYAHIFGAFDIYTSPLYIRQKFKDIDKILKTDFSKKLFFIFEKKAYPPYHVGSLANYYFMLKNEDAVYFSETEGYLISDATLLDDENFFTDFIAKSHQYGSAARISEISHSIQTGNFKISADQYLLGGGAIALVQSLYPKIPLIHFGHKEWDNSTILIFEGGSEVLVKTDMVAYSGYLNKCFLDNRFCNNACYVCSTEETQKYNIKLMIKYSNEPEQTELTQEEINYVFEKYN